MNEDIGSDSSTRTAESHAQLATVAQSGLLELIAGLETLTAPARALDFAIWFVLFGQRRDAPIFTGSIDAALTLVPEHSHMRMATCHEGIVGGHAWIAALSSPVLSFHDINTDSISTAKQRRSLAVAICIAALKARLALSLRPQSPTAHGDLIGGAEEVKP